MTQPIAELKQEKKGLLQQLLTGKHRVKGLDLTNLRKPRAFYQ